MWRNNRYATAGVGKHPWRNCHRTVRNQGQIGPKVTGTTDIRNTLQVPLTTTIRSGRSSLLPQNKPRFLTESVSWWLTSCGKCTCAKHSLFYWRLVRKIMPGWNRSAVRKRLLPTPALPLIKRMNARSSTAQQHCNFRKTTAKHIVAKYH